MTGSVTNNEERPAVGRFRFRLKFLFLTTSIVATFLGGYSFRNGTPFLRPPIVGQWQLRLTGGATHSTSNG